MKRIGMIGRWVWVMVFLVVLVQVGLVALAGDVAPVDPASSTNAVAASPIDGLDLNQYSGTAVKLAAQYPWVTTILIVVGALRLCLKPAFSIFHTIVAATKTTKDDEILAEVEQSKITKGILYVLDWLGSVKLVKP